MAEMLLERSTSAATTTEPLLLGDEAVAQGALDAGIAAAYGYPGTPSTEVMEYLLAGSGGEAAPRVAWCANEKSAYEQALGVSMAGRRVLAVMKHVGVNVAADPFVNSALVEIAGGLVLAVADDPGMASSQNEQDTRLYAELARVPCFEPADPQEAYDMTREAFDLSERFHTPVVVRLVTRLAHSRAGIRLRPARPVPSVGGPRKRADWTLLPANARRRWRQVLARQPALEAWLQEGTLGGHLTLRPEGRRLGVVTAGVSRNDYLECLAELADKPSHLHIGAYPASSARLRRLADHVDAVLVLEEGRPILEERLRGLVREGVEVRGRLSGHLPADGALSSDLARRALGLPDRTGVPVPEIALPARPPQLCRGCPHRDSFAALTRALEGIEGAIVPSDIGCYTLGALPPIAAIDSCVCMGASIGMAKGAADAGLHPAVAVIGDSTFLHSGVAPLLDAAAADTPMTVLILDNAAVGMTGAQDTVVPSSHIEPLLLGLGVHPDHCRVIRAHPTKIDEMARVIREEIDYPGLSAVVLARECIEHARRRKAGRRDPEGRGEDGRTAQV